MSETVLLDGARDVRASLDAGDADAVVVACPPDPRMGGSRSDPRLRAAADALGERGVACLRLDYGEWDEGRGERTDADRAVAWAHERFDRVGLFGYSFGGAVALLAAADEEDLGGVAALAPAASLPAGLDVAAAVADVDVDRPLLVVSGDRDTTVDWEAVVGAVRERDANVETLPTDHFFGGHHDAAASLVAEFFVERAGL